MLPSAPLWTLNIASPRTLLSPLRFRPAPGLVRVFWSALETCPADNRVLAPHICERGGWCHLSAVQCSFRLKTRARLMMLPNQAKFQRGSFATWDGRDGAHVTICKVDRSLIGYTGLKREWHSAKSPHARFWSSSLDIILDAAYRAKSGSHWVETCSVQSFVMK